MGINNDFIGTVAQNAAQVALGRRTSSGYLFRPVLLADKWPTVDLYAELPYGREGFFVQVKGTERGYKKKGDLKVNVSKRDWNFMEHFHAPCYIIGVDVLLSTVPQDSCFIIGVKGIRKKALSWMPIAFPLNDANMIKLRDEVQGFWAAAGVQTHKQILKEFLL